MFVLYKSWCWTDPVEVCLTICDLKLFCQDLRRRIDQTRSFPSLEDSQFNYGFNSHCLQKVVSYWRNEFDWKKQVEKLNKYPHFKTKIEGEVTFCADCTALEYSVMALHPVSPFASFSLEGIDIHFLHVRPRDLPEGTAVIPLLMVHGWPGSFYEFYGMLPLLTEPANPGDIVFEVICPSLPGYGYSEAPHKKGGFMWVARGLDLV